MTNYEMKPIEQLNNRYMITTKGEVVDTKYDKFVIPYAMGNQMRVTIRHEGKLYNLGIARLVAEAFLPSPQLPKENLLVIHLDGNSYNNNVDNLKWMTKSESTNYQCYCLGRRVKPVRCIETGEEYPSISEAARRTGISHIHQAASGSRKSAGGYHWEYIKKEAE